MEDELDCSSREKGVGSFFCATVAVQKRGCSSEDCDWEQSKRFCSGIFPYGAAKHSFKKKSAVKLKRIINRLLNRKKIASLSDSPSLKKTLYVTILGSEYEVAKQHVRMYVPFYSGSCWAAFHPAMMSEKRLVQKRCLRFPLLFWVWAHFPVDSLDEFLPLLLSLFGFRLATGLYCRRAKPSPRPFLQDSFFHSQRLPCRIFRKLWYLSKMVHFKKIVSLCEYILSSLMPYILIFAC